jgi:ribosomal protein S20
MSKLQLTGMAAALVVASLVGGTVISAVAAAPTAAPAVPAAGSAATSAAGLIAPAEPVAPTTPGARGEPGAYCLAFRAAFAKNLGVTQDQLVAAAKAAAASAVDKAVADGTMTADAAARVKQRIAAADADGCGILAGARGKAAKGALAVARGGLAAAAQALDMTVPDLRDQLKSGTSLKDVAAAKGVAYDTVSAAVTAAVKADLDAAVKAGTITQARADRILERVGQHLADGWTRRERGAGAGAGAGSPAGNAAGGPAFGFGGLGQ